MSDTVVFLYPGQGAQHVGMGRDLYQRYTEARRVFERADKLLGFALTRLCFEGPENELNQDLNAQLACCGRYGCRIQLGLLFRRLCRRLF